MKKIKKNKGQSTLEFAILLFCIVAALISMTVYIKRGIQGRLRTAAQEISQSQYAPGQTEGYFKTALTQGKSVEVSKEPAAEPEEIGGIYFQGSIFKQKETITNETTTTQGQETVH